ncbi:MAG: hypothetical protein KC502_12575 [Myxococcales bacterium]|nr:hypothetical protein [Myxococcales bacterium]
MMRHTLTQQAASGGTSPVLMVLAALAVMSVCCQCTPAEVMPVTEDIGAAADSTDSDQSGHADDAASDGGVAADTHQTDGATVQDVHVDDDTGATSTPDSSVDDGAADDAVAPDGSQADALGDGGGDAGPLPCKVDGDCGSNKLCVGHTCVDSLAVWPNALSKANSDPWLPAHHEQIQQLRPRVLALNFVNAKTNAQMAVHLGKLTAAMIESSRPHGYKNADAPAMWRPTVVYEVDLRDKVPPAGYKWANSTHYPREQPKEGYWAFDYEQLFTKTFAAKMNIADPKGGGPLDLCTLINRGLVHEVWIYADADVPGDVNAAEILERKARYDAKRKRLKSQALDGCAGNGCFDAEDAFPSHCTRTIRIAWVNQNRGPGCFMEALTHGIEGTGNRKPALIPYFSDLFPAFAGFDLDTQYKLPFKSWYSCKYEGTCLSYPTQTSVTWDIGKGPQTLQNYVPACGNVHFPPNARKHYDLKGPATVMSTCEGYGQGGAPGGGDVATPFTIGKFSAFNQVGQDCMGPWLIWWMQNMPGFGSKAKVPSGEKMLSWLPFIYY